MSVIIKGGSSLVNADVDSNKNLMVNTPTDVTKVGHIACAAEADPGTIAVTPTGNAGRQIKDFDISQDYRVRVGTDTIMFYDNFQGSAVNIQLWTNPVTTYTMSMTGGVVFFNNAASAAASAVARLQTWRQFPFYQTFTTYFETRLLINALYSNAVTEFGFGFASAITAPTDGAFFRYDATGNFRCVLSFNGTETPATPQTMPTINQYHHYVIGVSQDYVEFWVDNILYALIPTPVLQPSPTSAASLPVFLRTYNTAAGAGGATAVKIAEVLVTLGDCQTNKPWPHILAGYGQNIYQAPTNIAAVTTQGITNSAAAAAFGGSNITCTYAATLLSGEFRLNAAGTAETDFIIFAYLNVQGTSLITGRNMYITGCRISTINFGAVCAGTVTTLEWFLGFQQTAITMATTDTTTAKAARRIGLGFQYFPIGAPVGYPANTDIDVQFQTPYMVSPGEYVHVLCRQIVGTATGSETYRGLININGYWE